ncbi:MAG: very short patch repair endonuclease [Deltaproteobacteria bacterium]|nr:very short patch repair endonuclease [Deltaproteobacteria bacterium]
MDNLTKKRRSWTMSRVRSRDTVPEMYIRSSLFRRGYRYRVNYRSVPGSPDLYFIRAKVAVFVHGCFWHGHAGCRNARLPKSRVDYWTAKFQANIKRDGEVKNKLLDKGVRVLVIWECTVKKMMKNARIHYSVMEKFDNFFHRNLKRYAEI